VTKRNWTGTGLALALCIAALPACSRHGNSSNQASSNAEGGVDVQWNKKLEKQLREVIANAPANGLKPDLFLKDGSDPDDAALTAAGLKYAEALANGYADPTKISAVYTIARPKTDVRQGFIQAIKNGDLKSWFDSLPPQTDEYRALSEAHLRFLKAASNANFQPVPQGKPIRPGGRDSRVPAIAAALASIGYFAPPPQQQQSGGARTATRYTPALVSAVRHLQSDFGLKTDGIVSGATLGAINLGPAGLARQLAVAMERLRWLQRDPPATRIDVNTAATFLDYWRGGQHIDRRPVVTGEPDKQTPQIQANFSRLVANPKWRVPDSIAEKELATKSQGWLVENDFVIENGHYVQQSGDKNSLGLVKFDMEDKQQIYMHDTPAKALFALPDRHRSHGCVRVSNAIQFAEMLASQDGVLDQLEEALASGDEKWVKLKTAIPVRMLYQTAFWDGSRIQFRPDAYGWDDDVAAALGLVRGAPRQPYQPQGEDIGP
jgi:murein L,D-transpeptidase YcbB/YkuD